MPASLVEFTPAHTASGGTVSTTKTCTAGSSVAAFFWCSEWNSPPTPTCTVGGNNATVVDATRKAVGEPYARSWLAENVAGGSITVTVSGYDSGRAGFLMAAELLDVPTSSALDVNSAHSPGASASQQFFGAATGGVTIASGSIALSCQMVQIGSPGTLTPDTGWTALTSLTDSSQLWASLIWKLFPSGGSSERGLNQGAANDREYQGLFLAVKEAAGGGGNNTLAWIRA